MVNLFGKNLNTVRLQQEMNDAVQANPERKEKKRKKPSALDKDMYHLSKTYGERGFTAFLVEAQKIRQKWEGELGDDVPFHLYRRIGDILFKEEKFKESEGFYQLALERDADKNGPNSSYTLVQLSKAFIMQGKFDYAKQALRQAYNVKRNIFTAALYGEICFRTGEKPDIIKSIVEPYVHEALQKPQLEYAQGMVLSLNFLTTPSLQAKRALQSYSMNNFSNHENSLRHIAETIEELSGSKNMIDKIRERNTFARAASNDDDGAMSEVEAQIIKQYKSMNVRWDIIESSRAISRQDSRAASTRGYRPRGS